MKKSMSILLLLPAIILAQDVSKLELQDVAGKKFIMKKNLDNDATVVLFWATYCLPCRKEFPEIQSLLEKYPDKNIKVIAISQDSPRSLAKVKSFVKTHQYDFTYLLDPNGNISSRLLVNSVPFTMLVDSDGKVIYSHRGYKKGDELELEKQMLELWSRKKKKSDELKRKY